MFTDPAPGVVHCRLHFDSVFGGVLGSVDRLACPVLSIPGPRLRQPPQEAISAYGPTSFAKTELDVKKHFGSFLTET